MRLFEIVTRSSDDFYRRFERAESLSAIGENDRGREIDPAITSRYEKI